MQGVTVRLLRLGSAIILVLAAAAPCGGQAASGGPAPQRRFSLGLEVLGSPRYDAQRELRLALWSSPMARLELAVARELRAAKHPGPVGLVLPSPWVQLPLHLDFGPPGQGRLGLTGPWSEHWRELSWSEKAAATAETALFVAVIAQAIRQVR